MLGRSRAGETRNTVRAVAASLRWLNENPCNRPYGRRVLCAVISASAQIAAPAGAPPGRVEVILYGAGASSCGKWLAAREGNDSHGFSAWVLGWVSAAGMYNARGELRHSDAQAMSAWVDKYCREHPLNELADAATSLVDELSKAK